MKPHMKDSLRNEVNDESHHSFAIESKPGTTLIQSQYRYTSGSIHPRPIGSDESHQSFAIEPKPGTTMLPSVYTTKSGSIDTRPIHMRGNDEEVYSYILNPCAPPTDPSTPVDSSCTQIPLMESMMDSRNVTNEDDTSHAGLVYKAPSAAQVTSKPSSFIMTNKASTTSNVMTTPKIQVRSPSGSVTDSTGFGYTEFGLACVMGWQNPGFNLKQRTFLEEWFKLSKYMTEEEAVQVKSCLGFRDHVEILNWVKHKRCRECPADCPIVKYGLSRAKGRPTVPMVLNIMAVNARIEKEKASRYRSVNPDVTCRHCGKELKTKDLLHLHIKQCHYMLRK